jgi:tetratricopeptide (TPR) repeat protein
MRKAPPGRPARITGRNYGPAFERATDRIGGGVHRVLDETMRVPALLQEILSEPAARRQEWIRADPRFHLVKLCQRFEAESREAWADNPARAVELAELALAVAENLDSQSYGDGLVADTCALAWAYLGNALRIASHLGRAEQALDRAEEIQQELGSDLLTEAEILGFRASLRNTQGRFDEGARLLDRCFELYREAGDRHQQGRTLILKGMVLGDSGRLREAIRTLRSGRASTRTGSRGSCWPPGTT